MEGWVGGREAVPGRAVRTSCQGAVTPPLLPGQRPISSTASAPKFRLPVWTWPFGEKRSLHPPPAFPKREASMERLLAQLCGTSALHPLPVWEEGTTGHCFTQLVLSVLPHALLAVLSACHWGAPRWVETNCQASYPRVPADLT